MAPEISPSKSSCVVWHQDLIDNTHTMSNYNRTLIDNTHYVKLQQDCHEDSCPMWFSNRIDSAIEFFSDSHSVSMKLSRFLCGSLFTHVWICLFQMFRFGSSHWGCISMRTCSSRWPMMTWWTSRSRGLRRRYVITPRYLWVCVIRLIVVHNEGLILVLILSMQ